MELALSFPPARVPSSSGRPSGPPPARFFTTPCLAVLTGIFLIALSLAFVAMPSSTTFEAPRPAMVPTPKPVPPVTVSPATTTSTTHAAARVVVHEGPKAPGHRATSVDVASLHQALFAMGTPRCALEYFEANFLQQEQQQAVGSNLSTTHGLADLGVDMVYMIHYTPMKARRAKMTEMLDVHRVHPFWVLGFDKEALTADMIRCFHQSWNPSNYSGAKAMRHKRVPISNLKPSQISVVVKHHSALYDLVRRGYANALILEDDAFLRTNFLSRFGEVLRSSAQRPWLPAAAGNSSLGEVDVLFTGGCMRMHGYRIKFRAQRLTKHLYRKQEARCAHSFFLTRAGAMAFLASAPFTLPIDFQLTTAMRERNVETLWVEPWLSIQGNLGGCVTNDIGAACVSVEKKYDGAFDIKYAHETGAVDAKWDMVPA